MFLRKHIKNIMAKIRKSKFGIQYIFRLDDIQTICLLKLHHKRYVKMQYQDDIRE